MLQYFKVEFFRGVPGFGPFVHVLANHSDDAAILAKAQRIATGNEDHAIEHVWQVKDEALLEKVKPLASVGLPRIFDIDSVS